MPQSLVTVFSLLVAAAGWYYMFYSRAAHRLGTIEGESTNRRRRRLRRTCGFCMFMLAIGFFAGFRVADEGSNFAFVLIWMSVMLLLLAVVVLAMVDVRLTWKLKQRKKDHE